MVRGNYGSSAATTSITGRVSGLALANLSLAVAFAVSFVLPLGSLVLNALGIASVLRILEPHQQFSVFAIANYVLPAIVIYAVVRLSAVETRLRPTVAAYVLIGMGNVLFVLFTLARIYASTIEGGGAGFAVVTYGFVLLLPAALLYVFGFRKLLRTSQAPDKLHIAVHWTRRLTRSDGLLLSGAILLSLAYGATLPVDRVLLLSGEFSRLCERAEIKFLEPVQGARSVALQPDMFSNVRPGHQAVHQAGGPFLLNQSLLEFVERPRTAESGTGGEEKFERISVVGERFLGTYNVAKPVTQLSYEPVAELTAEYAVRSSRLTLEHGAELGLGGARIEIARRQDDHLIAYAEYYWNNTEYRACPEAAHVGVLFHFFITTALGVENPASGLVWRGFDTPD